MNKEKIIFKTRGLGIGGIERLTIDVLNNLKFENKEFVLIIEDREENFLIQQLNSNIKIEYLLSQKFLTHFKSIKFKKENQKKLLYKFYFGILLEIKRKLIQINTNKLIKKYKAKLFIDYSGHSISHIKKIKNVKKILWIHSSIADKSLKKQKKYLEKIDNYDKIVVICDEMKDEILKIAPYLRKKIKKIYNFVDEKKIRQKISEEFLDLNDEKYCVMLGRIDEGKDYLTAIKAFKLLKTQGLQEKLYIIGDGEKREELEKIVRNERLEDIIIFKGRMDNPYPFLNNASIFIHTSKSEGFGLVLVEAGICNIPIISSNYKCGAKEILNNGKNGILFEVGDFEKLANEVKGLLENKIKQEEMIKNFNKDINRFTMKKVLEEYKKIIDEEGKENENINNNSKF